MGKFIIAGITQLETIVKVDKIPIDYKSFTALNGAIHTAAGGDAFNISLAMNWLGDDITFMTVVGRDQSMGIFNPPDREVTLDTKFVLPLMNETPMEVMFFDEQRKEQAFEDLKDIRDVGYEMSLVDSIIDTAEMVFVSNANFCRPIMQLAGEHNKKLAVKIHSFCREKEKYNADFLSAANIVFFSDVTNEDPFEFAQGMAKKYDIDLIIIGQGADGLVLHDNVRNMTVHYDPIRTGKVMNTAGAGNALFACFLHYCMKGMDATDAIHKALLFTSNKIGYMGTSNGFMTESQLEQWDNLIWDPRGTKNIVEQQ
ncbi:MAG: carbohydrate kinase family protein [Lachnospiraceae bacterium]|nr:carbohydrate kinase family protein [Lachnospiraceae bacterium]